MGARLFVGNLPFSATEGDVLELFRRVGTVAHCELIVDKFTNRSRGFAFVEMSTQEEARRAIAEFHGKDFQGRALTVNEARPRTERVRGDFGGAHDRGREPRRRR